MNYLEAKTVLLQGSPQISFTLIAAEAAALIGMAAVLVHLFS